MIWILPIAGRGSRTQSLGKFKPFIEVNGKKIIHWALLGIKHEIREGDQLVFVTTVAFEREYGVKQNLAEILLQESLENQFEVVLAADTPQGPAASVYITKEIIDVPEPCTVVNADQHIIFEMRRNLHPQDGFLPIYFNTSPNSSYARIKAGRVVSIHEKELVSNYASSGVYGFGSGHVLIQAIEQLFEDGETVRGEYYVGPAMNYLIRDGGTVYPAATVAKFDLGDENGIRWFSKLSQRNICNSNPLATETYALDDTP